MLSNRNIYELSVRCFPSRNAQQDHDKPLGLSELTLPAGTATPEQSVTAKVGSSVPNPQVGRAAVSSAESPVLVRPIGDGIGAALASASFGPVLELSSLDMVPRTLQLKLAVVASPGASAASCERKYSVLRTSPHRQVPGSGLPILQQSFEFAGGTIRVRTRTFKSHSSGVRSPQIRVPSLNRRAIAPRSARNSRFSGSAACCGLASPRLESHARPLF
ncbi:hypothetical protein OH77DRAFT_374856 [Trametes cingulata]|nr:hypothetical protein OH77DRAFT_374856 [Trametes cingulata]